MVDRALALAMSEPQGIAYLTLPREVLAEAQIELRMGPAPHLRRERLQPDPVAVKEAGALLASAESPLVITTSVGRDPDAVGACRRGAGEFMGSAKLEFREVRTRDGASCLHS